MELTRLTAIAQQVVTAAQRRLPADVKTAAHAVPVCYESVPSEELQTDGVEPDTLGLFVGPEHGSEFSGDSAPLPPQILLFLKNIWEQAEGNETDYRDEVRLTYLHELGHYLGWDEEEVARRGLE